MMGPGFFFGGWWMWLFWILVIAGVVLVVRTLTEGRAPTNHAGKSPQDILEERYARGEISEEEFLRIREQLVR